MNLDCEMCGKTTVLDEAETARIKAELMRSGVGAAYIWHCACGRFQVVLRLTPETPRWNLAVSR
jgi:hypothetical protein